MWTGLQKRRVPSSSKTPSTGCVCGVGGGGNTWSVSNKTSLFREPPCRLELALFLKCLDLKDSWSQSRPQDYSRRWSLPVQLKQQYLWCNQIVSTSMGAACHVYSVFVFIGPGPLRKQILKVCSYSLTIHSPPPPPETFDISLLNSNQVPKRCRFASNLKKKKKPTAICLPRGEKILPRLTFWKNQGPELFT